MNKVILMGNLTRDVELRTTPSGKTVATVSLATNKRWKDESGQRQERAEFHNLVIWQGAEVFAQYLGKGSKVLIEGEIQTQSWQDKDTGKNMYRTEVNVREFTFLDSKRDSVDQTREQTSPQVVAREEENEIRVEDIPF